MSRSVARRVGLSVLATSLLVPPAAAETTGLTVGAGRPAGVYHPVTEIVAGLLTDGVEGLDIGIVSTGGSMENLSRVAVGDLSMGIARSDVLNDALLGFGAFEGVEPMSDLRLLFALYAEPLVIIARADAGIASLDDLAGKTVNIGPAGSASRTVLEQVLEAWEPAGEGLGAVEELPVEEQVGALCDGRVDAIAFISATPTATVAEALKACETVLVPIEGAPFTQILETQPHFVATTIPAGIYEDQAQDVQTLGPVAAVVVGADMADDLAYRLTRALFERLDELDRLLPVVPGIGAEARTGGGLGAPLHPGAIRYYREADLLADDPGDAPAED